MKFRVVFEQEEDEGFVVTCPSLPGCISEGDTRAEALANIREAIEAYLASLKKHGEPIPPPIFEDVVDVSA
jgi:predicted RNase H-like HicB family nuclease